MLLARARQNNGFGPTAIAWSEIRAYAILTRSHFSAWEVEVFRLIDDEYLAAQGEQAE
ncbi:hypothetical protein UFOVP119_83 [uncultured Caudovirales phage]|uniref:Uncharacterized protein n=1 Tax=uncultured Caudovirales phage TaxID=2100421 RepID=A0A6J5LFP3_9CAUD|nr:hypothetical protein UFOVP119_83 [uncultured Caudovirales phage]